MADSTLSLLSATRNRVVTGQNTSASGAVVSKSDSDVVTEALEAIYTERAANPSFKAIDWIELAIGKFIDEGHTYPAGDPYMYGGAEWIAQLDITKLPNPMPRDFVLYLAMATVQLGKATSVHDTVLELINTYQFV